MESKSKATMKLWVLEPKDINEPPFHYVGVPRRVVVIAADEKSARAQAAASGPEMAPAGLMLRDGQPTTTVEERSPWMDKAMTTCKEPDLAEPGVLARVMA